VIHKLSGSRRSQHDRCTSDSRLADVLFSHDDERRKRLAVNLRPGAAPEIKRPPGVSDGSSSLDLRLVLALDAGASITSSAQAARVGVPNS
jgi:hypothetical protein